MSSAKYHHDVFALPMFGGRLYIVTTPSLVGTIQRHYKELSFWFLEGAFSAKLGGLSEHASKVLLENAAGREIGNSLVVDGMKQTHAAMVDGLEKMAQTAVDIIGVEIDRLEAEAEANKEIDLWKWVDDHVSLMTSAAVYGPSNPYNDPKLARGLR
jgi:hypothetical protein